MREAGILSGIGLIFTYLLGLIPTVGWGLSLVGLILFLVGVYRISKIANDERIFRYFLLPVILGFVALVIVIASLVGTALEFDVIGLGISAVALLVVVFILLIVSLVSYVRAYRLLAEVTGVDLFNTVATLYKWGAILLIVFGIGVILMIVGLIIAIVGFFSIEEKTS